MAETLNTASFITMHAGHADLTVDVIKHALQKASDEELRAAKKASDGLYLVAKYGDLTPERKEKLIHAIAGASALAPILGIPEPSVDFSDSLGAEQAA